jgi:hypothetical protein
MDSKGLLELLRDGEQPNAEYKSMWYDIDSSSSDTRERQRGELIKDIVALANGNITSAGKTAFLVIGASNKPNEKGERDLYDVGNVGDLGQLRQTVLQLLKGAIRPPIDDIRPNFVEKNGKRVLVIAIPPTPFLHETTRQLKVSGSRRTSFDENAVIIRRAKIQVLLQTRNVKPFSSVSRQHSRKAVRFRLHPSGLSWGPSRLARSLPQTRHGLQLSQTHYSDD